MHSHVFRMLLVLVLVLQPTRAFACLAGYRSTDWLVSEAQLIVLGEVVATEDMPKTRQDEDHGRMTLQKATVRVLRVLKGNWTGGDLQLGSGPIESCNPEPVYYHFTVGERAVFLLTERVSNGKTSLRWGGSVVDQKEIDTVIGCRDRILAWQQSWLTESERSHPGELAAATVLSTSLAHFCQSRYPARSRLEAEQTALEATLPHVDASDIRGMMTPSIDWKKVNPEQKQAWEALESRLQDEQKMATTEMAKLFANVPPRVLYTMTCQHWSVRSTSWRDDLEQWRDLADEALKERAQEMTAFRNEVLGARLTAAAVPVMEQEAFLAALPADGPAMFPWFPIETPIFSGGIDERKATPAVATTKLMLLAEDWDRGRIYLAYAMNDAVLAKLDPVRLDPVVHRLCGSPCDDVRNIGFRLVDKLPGTRFIPLVGDSMQEGRQYAWRQLVNDKDPEATALRFKALTSWVQNQDPWRRENLWEILALTRCFRTELIAGAIDEIQAWEKTALADRASPDREDRGEVAASAKAYLIAVRAEREPDARQDLTAADWKRWFAEHPEPVKAKD